MNHDNEPNTSYGQPAQPGYAPPAGDDLEDLEQVNRLGFPAWPEIVGLVAGLAPFVISIESSSVHWENGRVASASYSNPVAIVGGILAGIMGIVALAVLARTARSRKVGRILAGVALLALGGAQTARGFGAFFNPGEGSTSSAPSGAPSLPELAPTAVPAPPEAASDSSPEEMAVLRGCIVEGSDEACTRAGEAVVERCERRGVGDYCDDGSTIYMRGLGGPVDLARSVALATIG